MGVPAQVFGEPGPRRVYEGAMSWSLLLTAAGALVLLLAVGLRLRGPAGGRDLVRPPRPKPFGEAGAERLAELILSGEEEEAFRLLRKAGHSEASARKLIALVKRLGGEGEGAREREG